MTSFEHSKSPASTLCGKCGGELSWRPFRPYPVLSQVLFAGSFVLFLLFSARIQAHRPWLWSWCLVQAALGMVLIRQRLRARKRVLHCIRCDG